MKVLGIVWDRMKDFIQIPIFQYRDGIASKREVLHCVARVYDPLGLVAPVTFRGKLFLQKLWKINQLWDQALNGELSKEWSEIAALLLDIPKLCIPRFIDSPKRGTNQLLIFSDASINCCSTAVWQHGPDWLRNPRSEWPTWTYTGDVGSDAG